MVHCTILVPTITSVPSSNCATTSAASEINGCGVGARYSIVYELPLSELVMDFSTS
jgi:hypothetical protein